MKFSVRAVLFLAATAFLAVEAVKPTPFVNSKAILNKSLKHPTKSHAILEEKDKEDDAMMEDGLVEASSVRGGDAAPAGSLMHTLTVGFYFGAWYALNVMYNSESRVPC